MKTVLFAATTAVLSTCQPQDQGPDLETPAAITAQDVQLLTYAAKDLPYQAMDVGTRLLDGACPVRTSVSGGTQLTGGCTDAFGNSFAGTAVVSETFGAGTVDTSVKFSHFKLSNGKGDFEMDGTFKEAIGSTTTERHFDGEIIVSGTFFGDTYVYDNFSDEIESQGSFENRYIQGEFDAEIYGHVEVDAAYSQMTGCNNIPHVLPMNGTFNLYTDGGDVAYDIQPPCQSMVPFSGDVAGMSLWNMGYEDGWLQF